MANYDEVHPASISLQDYVECFLHSQGNPATTASSSKLIVKCNITNAGILRFSKVFCGGENKGENAELQLAKELRGLLTEDKTWNKCDIRVISNKSPSIISAEHFAQIFSGLRRKLGGATQVHFHIAYAHPCHYVNQRALSNLHRAGIKLTVMHVEDILSEALQDTVACIKGLTLLDCYKLRGLHIDTDVMMLTSSHFMLTHSFEIEGVSLAERREKGTWASDGYVTKLRKGLKKLQGISRGRSFKRQSIADKGRRSSSLDPYKQQVNTQQTDDKPTRKASVKNKSSRNIASPWQTKMYAKDWSSGILNERTTRVLNAVEDGNQEVYLNVEMYKADYILCGGPNNNKSSKTKAVDGKWTIQCYSQAKDLLYQEKGLVLKNGCDEVNKGLSNPQLRENMATILTNSGEKSIVVELEILLTSLPDRNNFVKQAVQLSEKLSQIEEIEHIVLVAYFAEIETFTVPSKQALRKLLKTGENGKFTKTVIALKPLHLHVILNLMMDDLLKQLCNLQLAEATRGISVQGKVNELSAALHLMRSAIKIADGKQMQSITEEPRLSDKHSKQCNAQLDDIIHITQTK